MSVPILVDRPPLVFTHCSVPWVPEGFTRVRLAFKQALHLGDMVKSRRARSAREETRKRGGGGFRRSLARFRADRFARPNIACVAGAWKLWAQERTNERAPVTTQASPIRRAYSQASVQRDASESAAGNVQSMLTILWGDLLVQAFGFL